MRDLMSVKSAVVKRDIHQDYLKALSKNNFVRTELLLEDLSYEWCAQESNYSEVMLGKHSVSEFYDEDKKVSTHFNIAAHAAMQDSRALDQILKRWPSMQFLQEALNQIEQAAEKTKQQANRQAKYKPETFDKAKTRLFLAFESPMLVGNKVFQYREADKQLMQHYWQQEIDSCHSFSALLKVYDNFKDKGFIIQCRHREFDSIRCGFGFFKQSYPKTQIKFIEALQQRALKMVGERYREDNSFGNLSEEIEGLLKSELFAHKHFEHGVSAKMNNELEGLAADMSRAVLCMA